jgi:hypothetical protein
MEIALRASHGKIGKRKQFFFRKSKKSKGVSNEQEDLLKRTLKNR